MTTAPGTNSQQPVSASRPVLLNLGCGASFHPDWLNVDLAAADPSVLVHNLCEPLPFDDRSFAVVYHSHVLEHLPRERARPFIRECYRVLRADGSIRVAVPDLERIATLYLETLKGALAGDPKCQQHYEWIIIELLDQLARQHADGGEMFRYLCRDPIPALDFVIERLGYEVTSKLELIEGYVRAGLTPEELETRRAAWGAEAVGRFRTSGAAHLWMYDRYSLGRLLADGGFSDIEVVPAQASRIPGFARYHLDVLVDGSVRKPDSLFMEATKTQERVKPLGRATGTG